MDIPASDTIEFVTPESQPPILGPNLNFTTLLGLFVAFSASLSALQLLGSRIGMSQYGSWMLGGSAEKIICIAMLLGIVVFVERRSIRSVGLVPLTRQDVELGLALFVVVVAVSGGFVGLLYLVFPGFFTTGIGTEQGKIFQAIPVGVLLFEMFVNGFFEEIAARGFAIDRLQAVTGSLLLASAGALFLDLAAHVPFWGWKHAILIFPAQTLFVLMYLWRRNISACIIAHILVDSVYVILGIWGIAALSLFGGKNTHAMLASQAFYRDDYKSAIAEYSKALQQRPADAKLLSSRAEAEYRDYDYGAAIQDLDEVIRHDPANVDAYESRAMAYYGTGWYEQALIDANHAVSLAPKQSDPYSYRAYVLVELKQYDKAVADLSDAIKYSDSKDGDLYSRRGLVYLSQDDYDHAIADLTEAVKLDGNQAEVFENRASAYLGKKQEDLAIADLTHAIRISPKDPNLYLKRATEYQNRQKYDLALADLKIAAEAYPGDSTAENALAWMMSTSPNQKFRNGKEAITHAYKACDLSSWQESALIDTLAAAYAEAGDFPKAIMWQQRAMILMKSDTSGQQQDSAKRLELYKAKQPYRDNPTDK